MRGFMILAVVLGAAACSSPTAQVAQVCQTAPDGTQTCQPAPPVSYQKSSQRYTAR